MSSGVTKGAVNRIYNGSMTTFTCNGATPVTVAWKPTTGNTIVHVTLKTVGGTVGAIPRVVTITPGTGFTIAGSASDTSIYNLVIID